jgi:hypothetical protein
MKRRSRFVMPAIYHAQELGLNQIVNVTELNIPYNCVAVCTTRRFTMTSRGCCSVCRT